MSESACSLLFPCNNSKTSSFVSTCNSLFMILLHSRLLLLIHPKILLKIFLSQLRFYVFLHDQSFASVFMEMHLSFNGFTNDPVVSINFFSFLSIACKQQLLRLLNSVEVVFIIYWLNFYLLFFYVWSSRSLPHISSYFLLQSVRISLLLFLAFRMLFFGIWLP